MDYTVYIWLFCLLITHTVAYLLGKGDGNQHDRMTTDDYMELKKYEMDKQFELAARIAEMEGTHDES
jgi:hypothetical protein